MSFTCGSKERKSLIETARRPLTQGMWWRKLNGPQFRNQKGRKALKRSISVHIHLLLIWPPRHRLKKVRFDWRLTSATHLWHQLKDKRTPYQKKTNTFNNLYSLYSRRRRGGETLTEQNNATMLIMCWKSFRLQIIQIRLCPQCAAKIMIHFINSFKHSCGSSIPSATFVFLTTTCGYVLFARL